MTGDVDSVEAWRDYGRTGNPELNALLVSQLLIKIEILREVFLSRRCRSTTNDFLVFQDRLYCVQLHGYPVFFWFDRAL